MDIQTWTSIVTMIATGITILTVLTRKLDTARVELKADIADLRTELKADIADLRTELKTDIHELRTDVRALMPE